MSDEDDIMNENIEDTLRDIEKIRNELPEIKVTLRDIEKMKDEFPKIKNEIEKIHINIIQIVAVVVAVLALILGNVVGVVILPSSITIGNLLGTIFLINGIVLTGIFFLIFLIRKFFFDKQPKEILWIFAIPVTFQIIGSLILIFT